MGLLVIGLLLFLGAHSVRLWGEGVRTRLIEGWGEGPWKGLYTVASLAGLVMIVRGYGQARMDPTILWALPVGVRHFSSLLVLVAFVAVAASYVPGSRLKASLGHPMAAGTALWALAHLLSNGTVADLLLFGGFLVWSVGVFIGGRRRDAVAGVVYPVVGIGRDLLALGIGVVLWCVLAFGLHAYWFGVSPFG